MQALENTMNGRHLMRKTNKLCSENESSQTHSHKTYLFCVIRTDHAAQTLGKFSVMSDLFFFCFFFVVASFPTKINVGNRIEVAR